MIAGMLSVCTLSSAQSKALVIADGSSVRLGWTCVMRVGNLLCLQLSLTLMLFRLKQVLLVPL